MAEQRAGLEAARELLERSGIHTVECMFADTWGGPRGKRLPTKHFLKVAAGSGFAIANVYVFPGLPTELVAMFEAIEDEFRGAPPILAWRRTYRTHESEIASVLAAAGERWPDVLVGSYPTFDKAHPEVEIVLKSSDVAALAQASAFVERSIA